MRMVFMGTPEASAYVLDILNKNSHKLLCVLTQPDRPSGRGRKLKESPVKTKARELGIETIQAEKFNKEVFESIKVFGRPELAVVVAYGLYVPSYFLEYPKLGCLNIHFSLLPNYRGAAPVARAIMNGESKTGVSIMRLGLRMDEGDVLAQSERLIEENDTNSSLTEKLAEDGAKLLLQTIDKLSKNELKPVPQSSMGIKPSYAAKIRSEERFIDWRESSRTIYNKVRALYDWPCAETKLDNLKIKLIKTSLCKEDAELAEAGTIIDLDKKRGFIKVASGSGSLLLEKVQVSGKREMLVSEFLNGYKIKKGMRFKLCTK